MSIDNSFMDKLGDKSWDEAVDEFGTQLESAVDAALNVLPPALVIGMIESFKIGMLYEDEEED